MPSIIISKKQLVKLTETAMDLDMYVQPIDYSSSNGNEDLVNTIDEVKDKLTELNSMFTTGRKISTETEGNVFKILDMINKVYDNIKYQNQFTSL